ncbi:MAG: hypothetical protein HON90_05400 [Halobacteriovoraceae bacterium]|nr:hypothetical protein [Halobacteriovoraceae bacterium]
MKQLKFSLIYLSLAGSVSAYCSTVSTTVLAPDAKPLKSNILYKMNFSSKIAGYSEGEDEATQVLFGFTPELKFLFSEQFNIKANATLNLSSSRSQSRFQEHSNDSFVLNELSLNYSPVSFGELSVGSLDQSHLETPYLLSGVSFPGALVKLQAKTNDLSYGYKVQELIPTSNSFDSDRTEKEALPRLQTQGVFASYNGKANISAKAQINYFKFTNLPSVVAYDSKLLGNTIQGLESSDSSFAYEFSGFAQSYKVTANYTSQFEQSFGLSIVENENLTSGSNRAQMIETSVTYHDGDIDYIAGLGLFYAETDVAPG